MLKLLKYDFRRYRDQIIGLFAVMLLLQVIFWGAGSYYQWNPVLVYVLQALTYLGAGAFITIHSCRTYDANLKSYGRRLLPVRPIYTVLSPLLMILLLTIVLLVIIFLHVLLYSRSGAFEPPADFSTFAAAFFFNVFMMIVVLMVALLFSITVAHSLSPRGKIWIGILTFFAFNFVLVYMEGKLFPGSGKWMDFSIHYYNNTSKLILPGNIRNVSEAFDLGPALFEIALSAVVLAVSSRLLKKRVDL